MIVTVTGIGLWTRGLRSWNDFRAGVGDGFASLDDDFEPPKPAAIPARERRRAGLTINLAVEVMHQAADMAAVDKTTIPSVFTSAMGDTDVTDYMCAKLATHEKLLSPTRFHNSVHNATSGYWSISAANRQPSSFVAGFRDSFACGLLEAACCAHSFGLPVGLCAYDVANQAPFTDVLAISETLALALLVAPGETAGPAGSWRLELSVRPQPCQAAVPERAPLRRLAEANPTGTGLALLEALATGDARSLRWPVGAGTTLDVRLQPC